MRSRARFAVLLTTAAIAFAACTGGSSTPAPTTAPASAGAPSAAAPSTAGGAPVTVDWWHITTGEPGKSDFQAIADAYTKDHPNVKVNITVLENEAFKTKLA